MEEGIINRRKSSERNDQRFPRRCADFFIKLTADKLRLSSAEPRHVTSLCFNQTPEHKLALIKKLRRQHETPPHSQSFFLFVHRLTCYLSPLENIAEYLNS